MALELNPEIEFVDSGSIVHFRSRRLYALGVGHLFTSRFNLIVGRKTDCDMGFKGGRDRDEIVACRAAACQVAGSEISNLTVLHQVHSGHAVVVEADGVGRGGMSKEDVLADADGMVTEEPGAALMILTADCVPVLIFDPEGRVGALHAGWRGAVAGIARNTVALMMERFGSEPGRLIAVLGPAIRSCCFEVGDEVADEFARAANEIGRTEQEFIAEIRGRAHVDLPGFVAADLAAGLDRKNIIDSGLCTSCLKDYFYSYRRDGRLVGSHGAMIAIGG
ncbi:MAG: peptidoglycan editing factor PgeF [Candidatus Coatesbacteria bacterium]|nr:peptidoglycan editing factor PgeF [Candidatus Coatesbacteria bacterium]